jgi:hypothetical protein
VEVIPTFFRDSAGKMENGTLLFFSPQQKESRMSDSPVLTIHILGRQFPFGKLVATRNALQTIPQDDIINGLNRHANGDWGDLDREDNEANNRALKERGRLLSAYHSKVGDKFWIITEADRSVTTVLLPEDY